MYCFALADDVLLLFRSAVYLILETHRPLQETMLEQEVHCLNQILKIINIRRKANNWEHYSAGFLVFSEAAAVKVCRKRKDRTSKAHTCADEAQNIYPTNVYPGGAT